MKIHKTNNIGKFLEIDNIDNIDRIGKIDSIETNEKNDVDEAAKDVLHGRLFLRNIYR